MKKFLLRILFFLIMMVLVSSIPCIVFEKKALNTTDKTPYKRINEICNMQNVNADLIVLGNSRARESYNDSLMTRLIGMRCLNLGNGGYSFDYVYHIMYNNYLKQNQPPKYIIVDISPWGTFSHTNPVYTIQMLPYITRPGFEFFQELCPRWSKANYILFVKYFGKLGKVCKELDYLTQPTAQKSKPNNLEWPKDCVGEPHRVEQECDEQIINLFVRFLDECKEQNISVILVCSPMHVEDGLCYFDMDVFWNIIKWCNRGTKFPLVSYQDFFDSDTAFFTDPIHLNQYGKQVFTTKLMHDLDSVGIIKQHNNTIDR